MTGSNGVEPEIPLAKLEELAEGNPDPKQLAAAIRSWVEEYQPSAKASSVAAIAKAVTAGVDPSVISALTQAVGDDPELRDRVRPWLGLTRLDLRRRPFVVLAGGLMVKETPSRKNAGAHYTPKSLAEDVVLHALQPLCYSPGPHQTADETAWKLKSSDELLDLKVADIACGSGAFLVAAARYLSDRLVEAWIAEDPTNTARKNLHTRAVRQVVANCLYGADINDMAVEMCKLSLWLVSLDRDLPFSFVDDKVFLGNSLLGLTSLKQLRNLHIDGTKMPRFVFADEFDADIDGTVRRSTELRRALATPIDDSDPARSGKAKNRQLTELREVTAELRRLADGVVAAGLPLDGKPGKALDEAYDSLRLAAKQAEQGSASFLERLIARGLMPTVQTDYERWRPLHWMIEASDVFADRGGFDAVIGNPPFLVSKKISGAMGVRVREWIVEQVASGRRGPADLVAYFVLRAVQLLAPTGCIGLITSKVIAEGDTREVALESLLREGLVLTTATSSEAWPAAGVSVRYSMLCGTLNRSAASGPAVLDGRRVTGITSQLAEARQVVGDPVRLKSNSGRTQKGVFLLGDGFIVDAEEAAAWTRADPHNAEVLRPLLNGEDISSRADVSASRWVIDFFGLSVKRAAEYAEPFDRVLRTVKPERDVNPRKPRRENWWVFAENAVAMRKSVAELSHALVISIVSKSVMPVRVDAQQAFTSALGVFGTESYADQAALSSSAHQIWAMTYGSTLDTRVRYTPSDVFETFPLPGSTEPLGMVGRVLDEERREIMIRRDLGLTKLYNRINDRTLADGGDPDVARLRAVHIELDEVVMEAYGWSDIRLDHGFHAYRQIERWTMSPAARAEILDRLLEENHKRAAVEGSVGKSKARSPTATDLNQASLFNDGQT